MDLAIAQEEIGGYNPDRLLDVLRENFRLKNDTELARMLEVAPQVISKIRHRRVPLGAALLIRMHEVTGLNIMDLRYILGDRRRKFRFGYAQGRLKSADVLNASRATPRRLDASTV